MIMDEEASLLKRSWCLFELLQTVRRPMFQNAPGFVLADGPAVGRRLASKSLFWMGIEMCCS